MKLKYRILSNVPSNKYGRPYELVLETTDHTGDWGFNKGYEKVPVSLITKSEVIQNWEDEMKMFGYEKESAIE